MMNNIACKVVTGEDLGISLQNLEGLNLVTTLRKEVHPYQLVQQRLGEFGKLGPEFYVNTKELFMVAR
jgi:hypothetical protein